MTLNSNGTRQTAPGFHFFFQLKRASRKPFQIPCVFPSKTRLAYDVTVNLFDSQPTAPTFLFFENKTPPQESCHIPPVHCVFSGMMRLAFTSQCEFTCDAASPCRMSLLFPRENAPHRNRWKVSKNKGIRWPRSTVSKGDVGSCDSHLTKRVSLLVKSRCEAMGLTLPPKRVCVLVYWEGGNEFVFFRSMCRNVDSYSYSYYY